MTFEEAMAAVRRGETAWRPEWEGTGVPVDEVQTVSEMDGEPQLFMVTVALGKYRPSEEDSSATDWETTHWYG